eukprot:CAMPEP_0178710732 /NCGR_PEP_ID=MMETSP0699-20121125/17939_1 /TAXON_ID=265572 /ORGANISM="Extubocellulus spinifer, Strain CCMP396" /LENGTH=841 /DNA_ID=CAMNT_0020359303 /DNA_START=197 /DNA_END=2725 /DNA_ORIENTATION=+
MFIGANTRTEVAEALGVPAVALDYVSLLENKCCKQRGCSFPSADRNYGKCVRHGRSWFPRKVKGDGSDSKHCRGHFLLGSKFQREYQGIIVPSCCCTDKTCEGIGYSHEGMMRIPSDDGKDAGEFLGALPGMTQQRKKQILADRSKFFVAPWHFHPKHRYMKDGRWHLRKDSRYVDADGKVFYSAPPNYLPQSYIDFEVKSPQLGHDRTCVSNAEVEKELPSWVRVMAKVEAECGTCMATVPIVTPPRKPKGNQNEQKKPAKSRKKRKAIVENVDVDNDPKEQLRIVEAQLRSALERIDGLEVNITMKDEKILELTVENEKLKGELNRLQKRLDEALERKITLTFDDLKPGGFLGDYVSEFTYFPTYDANVAFLDLINYTEGRPAGDGFCENLLRYRRATREERAAFQKKLQEKEEGDDIEMTEAATVGLEEVPTLNQTADDDDCDDDDSSSAARSEESACSDDDDSGSEGGNSESFAHMYVDNDELPAMDVVHEEADMTRRGPERKLDWRTEYLIYSVYAHSGWKMRSVAALFGISMTLVSDIVYAWANVLVDTLRQFFPTPTRSQMLRAYPASVVRKFGHAFLFLLLDATEERADTASMKIMHAALFSAYKHHSTLKWLVGSDPIGTVWDDSISNAYPGAISDNMQTVATSILDIVPFGWAVEVDKGFLIDSDCAMKGLICIRPMKKLDGQTQQSKADTALTQKVGKTRIPIEQVNGQMQQSTSFFDRDVRLHQIGLANLIFRVGYLMQNFKLPFIQERDDSEDAKGRPCNAEIRWYGGTDHGLVDVRPFVWMWGLEAEVERWKEVREEFEYLTDTEVSEIVIDENWPAKLKEEMLATT